MFPIHSDCGIFNLRLRTTNLCGALAALLTFLKRKPADSYFRTNGSEVIGNDDDCNFPHTSHTSVHVALFVPAFVFVVWLFAWCGLLFALGFVSLCHGLETSQQQRPIFCLTCSAELSFAALHLGKERYATCIT